MFEENINQLIEALKDQQKIFGDTLFEKIPLEKIDSENVSFEIKKRIEVKEKSEESLFVSANTINEKFLEANNLDQLNKLICNSFFKSIF